MKAVDVLIVGAGPSGTILSALLKKCGVSNLLIEKKRSLSNTLGAHCVGNRAMEVLRHLGHLDKFCQSLSAPAACWGRLHYSESVQSKPIAVSDSFSGYYVYGDTYYDPHSPSKAANISQNRILSALHQLKVVDKNILWGAKFIGTESVTNNEIVAKMETSEGLKSLKCKYLIGADGVYSSVRQNAGIAYDSFDGFKGYYVSAHFKSKALQLLVKDDPFMIKFVFDKRPFVLVWYRDDEFVMHIPCLTRELQQLEYDNQPTDFISDVLGVPFEIKNTTKWVQNLSIVRNFTNEYGNIILVGDAAHQYIPTGGFGMNTGIGDAYSLYWRLYHNLKGKLPNRDRLKSIKAYATERLLVSHYILKLVKDVYKSAGEVPSMLGYNMLYAKNVAESASIFLPQKVVKKTLDFGCDLMSTRLSRRANSIRNEATQYLSHDDCPFRFVYTGADLNTRFIYKENGTNYYINKPIGLKAPERAWRYSSGPLVGRRIPHAWVYTQVGRLKRVYKLSTVDLTSISPTPRIVCLIIGLNGDFKIEEPDILRVVWNVKTVYNNKSCSSVDIMDNPLESIDSNGSNLLYSEFEKVKNNILEIFSSEDVLKSFKTQAELESNNTCIIIRPDAIVVDVITK